MLPNCYQLLDSALPGIELESIPFLLEPLTMLHTGSVIDSKKECGEEMVSVRENTITFLRLEKKR